jgi:lipopolysaccharide exporter
VPAAAESVIRKLLHGLRWNTGGLLVQALFQFVLGIALARILGPNVFGTMATAWATLTPALILADAGLGLALVQRELIATDEIKFCFLAQLVLGIAMAVALCLLSGIAARFFNEPELTLVIAALSSTIVLQALGLTSLNLLRRSVDFRRLQVVQISSYLASQLLFALPLALAGAGVWSLVAAAIANAALCSLGAYALVRHEIGWRFGRQAFRLPAISARFLLLNLINAALGALPPIAIGRLAGIPALGLFDRTFSLLVTPVDRAAAAVAGVLFSFYARTNERALIQHDVFLGCLAAALFFGIPGAVVAFMNGPLIIEATLGSKWMAATSLVAPLSPFIALLPALQVSVPVLNGRGRPDIEVGIVIGTISVFLAGVLLWAHDDLVRILWCLTAAYAFRVVCLLTAVKMLLFAGPAQFLAALVPGAAVAVLTVALNLVLEEALPDGAPSLLRLATIGLSSAALLLAAWHLAQALLPNGQIQRAFRGA